MAHGELVQGLPPIEQVEQLCEACLTGKQQSTPYPQKAKGIPNYFWGEAVLTTVYVLNRSFTRSVVGKTSFEAWFGSKPDVHYLRNFGCVAHAKSACPHLKKLDDRSTPMVFVGYENDT